MSEFPTRSADSGLHSDPISEGIPPVPDPGFEPELIENTDDIPTVLSKNRKDADSGSSLPRAIQSAAADRIRGKRLAHFELLGPVGSGGMAAVLLARDTQLDRLVALKILPPEAASDPEMVKRFHQEARAAAKLDHDHIARVFYCGEDKGLHFIAFEFVEGDNLRALLEKRGPLPPEEALNYMAQIASGLAHAAKRGVVHRDIKPSNIIITPEGRAKLVDMGLARVETPTTGEDLTHSGVTLGTFEYISPEQALEPRRVDVRSDIYSLGCTFYHVLTGRAPVPDGTAAKKLHFHQNVPPIDPRQWNPQLPDCVALILSRAMAKRPEDRYQTAEALLADIQAALNYIQASGRSTVSMARKITSPAPTVRFGMILIAGFALLVLLVIATSWFTPSEPIPAPPSLEELQADRRSNNGEPREPLPPRLPTEPKEAPQPNHLTVKVDSEQQLRQAFASQAQVLDVEITQPIILVGEAIRFDGTTQDGRKRKLRLHGNGSEPVILGRAVANGEKPGPILVLDGGEADLSAIHFRLSVNEATQGESPSALSFNSCDAQLTECIFEMSRPGTSAINGPFSAATVLATGANESAQADSKRPRITFQRCWFTRGSVACRLDGPIVAEYRDCAFGPHETLVQVTGRSEWLSTQITLDYCTLLVVSGPVFDIGQQIVTELALGHTIATRQDDESSAPGTSPRVLVYQRGELNTLARLSTNHCCFHALDAFWRNDGGNTCPTLNEFLDYLSKVGAKADVDRESVVLESADQPLGIASPLAYLSQQPPDAVTAFTANLKLLALRSSDDIGRPIIGTHWIAGQPIYSKLRFPAGLPPLTPAPSPSTPAPDPDAGKLIVDGKGENGRYKYLSWVFDDLEDDADVTIWIKQDGNVSVRPIDVARPGKVVLRPYPGYRPILRLAVRDGETEATMFNVERGVLVFEEIGFELAPKSGARGSRSLVTLQPAASCQFKSCLLTLRPAVNFSGELAVARLTADQPQDTGTASAATLEFTDCIVRGTGDGVHLYDQIPPTIQASNTLLALDGTFLVVHATHEVMPSVGSVDLRLNRLTGYVTGHLIHVRQDAKHFAVPVRAKVADSLFISGGGESLAYVEGVRSKQRLAVLLEWSGFHNAYCGFDAFFSGQMSQPGMAFPSVDKFGWQMKETMGGETGNTRFLAQVPQFPSSLDRLTPEQVAKAIEETSDTSRNVEKEDPLTRFGAILSRLQSIVPAIATGASEGVSPAAPASDAAANVGDVVRFLRKP